MNISFVNAIDHNIKPYSAYEKMIKRLKVRQKCLNEDVLLLFSFSIILLLNGNRTTADRSQKINIWRLIKWSDAVWTIYITALARVKAKHVFLILPFIFLCQWSGICFIMTGNDAIHNLSSHGTYQLKIRLADWDGNTSFAKYTTFRIASESDGYRLSIDGYSGNVGKCNINAVHGICSRLPLNEIKIVCPAPGFK